MTPVLAAALAPAPDKALPALDAAALAPAPDKALPALDAAALAPAPDKALSALDAAALAAAPAVMRSSPGSRQDHRNETLSSPGVRSATEASCRMMAMRIRARGALGHTSAAHIS